MVGIFVGLKLRLLINGLRDTTRAIGFALTAVFLLFATPAALAIWVAVRDRPELASDLATVAFVVVALGWAVLPLGLFGTDDTLDPARFALLPLRRRTLVTGLYASAFVGLTPVGTFLLLSGSVVALSVNLAAAGYAVAALAVELALCVALSRAVASALSGVLRSRRGRDFAIFVGVLIGGFGQLAAVGAVRLFSGSAGVLHDAATVAGWTPPGLAIRTVGLARDGRLLVASASLGCAALAVLLLLWWWSRTLATAMVTTDASTSGSRRRRDAQRRRWLASGLLPAGRAGAVALRELRYQWRDPRRRSGWVVAVVLGGVGPLVAFAADGSGSIYAVALSAELIGLQALNQLGVDGGATWMHVTTCTSRRDVRADFAGRNLAVAVVAVPLLILLAVALGSVTHELAAVPRAVALGFGVLALAVGVGNVASVLTPYPVPEGQTNAFAGSGAGGGCVAGLVAVGALVTTGILSVPLIIAAVVSARFPITGGVLLAAGIGYGLAAAWLGRWIAGERMYGRQPELLGLLVKREIG